MGSARVALEALEREEERERLYEAERKKRLFEKRWEKNARIAKIKTEFDMEEAARKNFLEKGKSHRKAGDKTRRLHGRIRKVDSDRPGRNRKKTGAPRGGR